MSTSQRLLIHVAYGRRRCLEPESVYYVEAVGGECRIRMRGARVLHDVRPLGDLETAFIPYGFLRIHRNHMINLNRVREIRRRKKGRDWEVKLDPPVNKVLPVSREHLAKLWSAFGSDLSGAQEI